jgi:hypothetical protein
VTYGNLRDKKNGIDQESEAVAMGALNLPNVIRVQKGDLLKAEELGRKSLRIRTLIFGDNDHTVGMCCNLIACILQARNKLGDDTRAFYERSLAICIMS